MKRTAFRQNGRGFNAHGKHTAWKFRQRVRQGERRVRFGMAAPAGPTVRIGQKKMGKLPVSRRYNLLPLLPSGPDGVQRELAVRDLPMLDYL